MLDRMASITAQPITASNLQERRRAGVTVGTALALVVFLVTFHIPSWGVKQRENMPQPVVSQEDLPNFHAVHAYLFRGGAPTLSGMRKLKALGVKTIVDFRLRPSTLSAERYYVELLGMRYVNLPIPNTSIPSPSKHLQFLSIVDAARTDPAQGPVFVHCSHGSDRTGYLIAWWRFNRDHWSLAEAFAEMLQYGWIIHRLQPNTKPPE
jgi:tyrosine-protein phosphatase SIW14